MSHPDRGPRATLDNRIDTLLITLSRPLSSALLSQLSTLAKHVHVSLINDPPASILARTVVLFCSMRGLPSSVTSIAEQMPNLRLIQTVSAGVEFLVSSPLFLCPSVRRSVTVTNASGVHVSSIPPYVVSTVVMLYMRIHEQFLNARIKQQWIVDLPRRNGTTYVARSVRGKTVGLLGYGSLGREIARLFTAMGARIVAANSRGQRCRDHGYTLPGTGDVECQLPLDIYSTTDQESFSKFLSRTDILVSSLPSTPQTRYMLSDQHFRLLARDAIFVNVGRGDVVSCQVLLDALDRSQDDANGPLAGVVVDVTDPEPLPKGHPLFTHPNVILTPHLSGNAEDEYNIALEICKINCTTLAKGTEALVNVVDMEKGY